MAWLSIVFTIGRGRDKPYSSLSTEAMGMPSRGPSRGIGDLEELNMIYDDYKQQITEVLGW